MSVGRKIRARRGPGGPATGTALSLVLVAAAAEFGVMWLVPRLLPEATPRWLEALVDAALLGLALTLFVNPVLISPLRARLRAHRERLARGVERTAFVEGEAFFATLVQFLGEHLEAACVIIGESRPGGRIRTLATWTPAGPIEPFEYDMAGTPCETAMRGEPCCIARGVAAQFPQDHHLVALGAEAYIGVPVMAASGETLGLVAVVGIHPLRDPESDLILVRLLAARAGAEFERSRSQLAEARTLARQAALQRLIDATAVMSVTDPSGAITHVNDKFCEITGYSREELLGQNHRLVRSELHPKAFWAELYRVAATGEVWGAEIENRGRDGSPHWLQAAATGVLDADGSLSEIIALRFDITAVRQAEMRAKSLAAAMGATSDGVALVDETGDILFCNPSLERMLELAEGSLIGSPVWSLLGETEQARQLEAAIRAGRDTLLRSPLRAVPAGAHRTHPRWVELVVTRCDQQLAGVEGFVCTCRDVTEQEHTERRLRYETDLAALRMACHGILSEAAEPLPTRVREILGLVGSNPALGFGRTGGLFAFERGARRCLAQSEDGLLETLDRSNTIALTLEYQGARLGQLVLSGADRPVCEHLQREFLVGLADLLAAALRTEQLREQTERLRREQAGTLFAMGREMRTPMTSIVAAADMLREPDLPPDDRDELTLMVRRNADHLLSVVDNVLDLAGVSEETALRDERLRDGGVHGRVFRGARVLVIEDHEHAAASTVGALRGCGAIVEVARRNQIGMSMALGAWHAGRPHSLVLMTEAAATTEVDLVPRLLREAGYPTPLIVVGEAMSEATARTMHAAGTDRVIPDATGHENRVLWGAAELLGGAGDRQAA